MKGRWNVYYRWENMGDVFYKVMTIDFKDDGTFSGKDLGKKVSGKWEKNVGFPSFQVDDTNCTYTGIGLNGKSITGIVAAFDTERQLGDFYNHHAYATKKSDLAKSPQHKNAVGGSIF